VESRRLLELVGAAIKTWKPHKDADARVESAKAFIRLLLEQRPPEGLEIHLKELLDVLVWKLTEAHGKWNTRFISKAALVATKEKLQHEHVHERKALISELLQGSDRIESVAAKAIGCVVTKTEHDRLTLVSRERPELQGWARYEAAGVEVIDRVNIFETP
jgi:hypothetical protein